MKWLIYIMIFCVAYSIGYNKGINHAHVTVEAPK
jgi:hypothetical protein